MPFEANISRARTMRFLLISVVFVAIGVFLIARPAALTDDRSPGHRDRGPIGLVEMFGVSPTTAYQGFGWLCIAFFGLLAVVWGRRLFASGVELRIDAEGIYWNRWSDQVIPWSAIKQIAVRVTGRQRFACLFLHDPSAYPSRTALGVIKRLTRTGKYGDISLTITDTDRSFDEMMAAIDQFAPAELH